jgi:SRSO17 transposase
MAEQAGLVRPYRMQSLLGRSGWDADALRDLVRDEVIACLGDENGVLGVDETGFLKKGTHSVGVARQYSGTAGRVENCQVGVFLGYASYLGQALVDRRLYLPEAWAEDDARRNRVQTPETVTFATLCWMAVCPVRGCWVMRFMAQPLSCGACWRLAASRTCWRCVSIITCVFWPGRVW